MRIIHWLMPALLLASCHPAYAWDIDKMNEQIEDTNVIVGGVCSGTIISKEQRLILTAYHCVADQFVDVTEKVVDPKTGEVHEVTKQVVRPLAITVNKMSGADIIATDDHMAKVVGSDSVHDIALIQVTDTEWVPRSAAPLAPDTYAYKRGLKVYAVGNPAITYDDSVTEGIISSPARVLHLEDKDLNVFQISASVIGGNSGGSIRNDAGEVIGTVSAGIRGSALSFAVPISYTKAMIRQAGFGSVCPRGH